MMMGGMEEWSVATGNDLQSNPSNDKKPNAEDGLATSANLSPIQENGQRFPYDSHTKQPFADLPPFNRAGEEDTHSRLSDPKSGVSTLLRTSRAERQHE